MFGVEKIRRRSIFAALNYKQAAHYGGVYFCFPTNGFKIIKGMNVDDSFEDVKFYGFEHDIKIPQSEVDILKTVTETFKGGNVTLKEFYEAAEKFVSKENIDKYLNYHVKRMMYGHEYEAFEYADNLDMYKPGELMFIDCDVYYVDAIELAYQMNIQNHNVADKCKILYSTLIGNVRDGN